MKLTLEQASALLATEPFFIVQIFIDSEGYQSRDFPPIIQATNVLWDVEMTGKWLKNDAKELGQEFRACMATYLCHVRYMTEDYPYEGGYWDTVECELMAAEPFPALAAETEEGQL